MSQTASFPCASITKSIETMINEMEHKSAQCPFISICIASYNYAQYLKRGFDAIKRQKFKEFEIIYIDDCSQDNSREIIAGFIKENPDMRIRYYQNNQNMGLLYTKTQLIYKAQGKYIMLCDADDWMAKKCLEKLAHAAQNDNSDRIISEVCNIDANGKILQIQDFGKNPTKWLWNIHHGCLYKRELLVQNHIEIEGVPDDVYLTTQINRYSTKISWIHEPLYYWLVHPDSEGRKNETDINVITEHFKQTIHYIDETIHEASHGNGPGETSSLLELLLMKVYYLQLFHTMRYYPLPKKISGYRTLQHMMKKAHPHYLKNPCLRMGKRMPVREYARKIIVCCVALERLHLMLLGIMGYHVISKFIYFDQ